jgi:hypothetical protein
VVVVVVVVVAARLLNELVLAPVAADLYKFVFRLRQQYTIKRMNEMKRMRLTNTLNTTNKA